jgi:hypothetical protein
MTRFPRGVLCERARSWAALAPDNELSELERKLLDAHLVRCAGCTRFAERVSAVAEELRSASLERPTYPIAVPSWRRRNAYARMRAVGAAAAVAAMALGVASRAPLPSQNRNDGFALPTIARASDDERQEMKEQRDLRRTQILIASAGPAPTGIRHFGDQSA